jgi:CheY-like chemotaxis protein
MHVLIADDSSLSQQLAFGLLTQLGHSADVVTNGADALEALSQRSYDLWLLDCEMPVLDGVTATEMWRTHEAHEARDRVKVIGLASNPTGELVERCQAAGMDFILQKPLRRQHLVEALSSDNPSTAGKSVAPAGNGSFTGSAWNWAQLEESACGNPERARKLAELLLQELRKGLGQLKEHLDTGVTAEAAKVAHRLAGSTAACGLSTLSTRLRELERLPALSFKEKAGPLFTSILSEEARAVKEARERFHQT